MAWTELRAQHVVVWGVFNVKLCWSLWFLETAAKQDQPRFSAEKQRDILCKILKRKECVKAVKTGNSVTKLYLFGLKASIFTIMVECQLVYNLD